MDVVAAGGFVQPHARAGTVRLVNVGLGAVPAVIAANGSWVSPLIFAHGCQILSVAVQMTTAGTLAVTRYIDRGGMLARAAVLGDIVANTVLVLDIGDGQPFATFRIEIDNGQASQASIGLLTTLLTAG
jgi:hypothetical protein